MKLVQTKEKNCRNIPKILLSNCFATKAPLCETSKNETYLSSCPSSPKIFAMHGLSEILALWADKELNLLRNLADRNFAMTKPIVVGIWPNCGFSIRRIFETKTDGMFNRAAWKAWPPKAVASGFEMGLYFCSCKWSTDLNLRNRPTKIVVLKNLPEYNDLENYTHDYLQNFKAQKRLL